MSTKEHWDAIFEKGQKYIPITEEALDALLVRVGQPHRVLDIACGTGDLVLKLARRGLAVTGADISSVALAKAREALAEADLSAQLVEADFNAPEFAAGVGGPYDLIAMRLAFAFARDRDALLEVVKGLLEPGGAFVCILPGLLPGGVYDERQLRISLPKEELEATINRHFPAVELFTEDYGVKLDWPLLTYICKEEASV